MLFRAPNQASSVDKEDEYWRVLNGTEAHHVEYTPMARRACEYIRWAAAEGGRD